MNPSDIETAVILLSKVFRPQSRIWDTKIPVPNSDPYRAIGHLIDLDPTLGDVIVNQTAVDPDPIKMFAIEDALQGRGIDDDYADNDQVMCYVAQPGDIVFALLETGTVVTQGTSLESAGDGTLQVRTTGATIGKALEALTASGVTRCKIMIT